VAKTSKKKCHGWTLYALSFFSLSPMLMMGLAVPLWGVSLGIAPSHLGVILSARSFLPLLLSIYGGNLLDQWGVRRTLQVLAVLSMFIPLLYPVLPFTSALILLELFGGVVTAFVWMCAQTVLGQVAKGDPLYASRFSFAASMGNLCGPFLLGLAWGLSGPWAAFGVVAAWGAALTLLVVSCGSSFQGANTHVDYGSRSVLTTHLTALKTMRDRQVAFVLYTTFIRIAAYTVQASFYVVALDFVGQGKIQIGILVGIAGLCSGGFTMLSASVVRLIGSQEHVLVSGVALAILSIAVTPAFSSFTLLLVLAILHGAGMGLSMPLLLSLLSEAASSDTQGLAVGLRSTANRLAGVVIPVGLGAAINMFGITWGFYLIGFLLLVFLWLGWCALKPSQ
jgi:MFS family permease|tara:strand:+ start:9626 stop:10807 length:1182 start_codon:yes stop_codon:yes gene_type:complete